MKERALELVGQIENYPSKMWSQSDDVAVWGIPIESGLMLMKFQDAVDFLANNDPSSMIAMRIPKEVWEEVQKMDGDDWVEGKSSSIELKEEYFLDYHGRTLI